MRAVPHEQSGTPDSPVRRPEQSDLLAEAYAVRTQQLHDARGALAEAVATLRAELSERRAELSERRAETSVQREEATALRHALHAAELRNKAQEIELERMQAELERQAERVSSLRNMKVVRWTAGPRGVVYRLRDRLR
jgi:chromosome segregation ATPase